MYVHAVVAGYCLCMACVNNVNILADATFSNYEHFFRLIKRYFTAHTNIYEHRYIYEIRGNEDIVIISIMYSPCQLANGIA